MSHVYIFFSILDEILVMSLSKLYWFFILQQVENNITYLINRLETYTKTLLLIFIRMTLD